ncbi:peptidoglycan-binding protein [Streptomyces silvisoli]|uniref:Peptidoglycan-binding protein n=1 Tax=Streptomyces silvisoli TaxID=3034235 RepID=A0ABT5ZKX5_9ACTN|nr:peptidoglycan-binding protein [Streptomyces silvisoli]MDF3290316.1 peptidoglycan-binding protein [Streptomyces silvisoli]
MSRWKELPEGLDPRARQLVVRLRGLKDHSGLSLTQLAAKTGYSRSSWERYLGGRLPPPEAAVEQLARTVGADPARLLALREVAAEAWTEPSVPDAAAKAAAPPTSPARRRGRRTVVAVVVAAVAVGAALLAVLRPWEDRRPRTAPGALPTYTCHIEHRAGHWYAGNSTTDDAVLQQGMVGPEVAEAQCLLQRAGYPPGGIDGIYGDLTERAVKRVQSAFGLVVDGKVGPHTWGALRG